MKRKKSLLDRVFVFCNTMFMLFMIFICLYPFWHVLMGSFSEPSKLMNLNGVLLKPLGFTLDSYKAVIRNPNIITGYGNTIFLVVVGTLSGVICCAIGGYCFSRQFPFKRPITFFFILTMYFSGGIIPTYLLNNNLLHLGNTRLVLFVPTLFSVYYMILLRTGFEGVPDSLAESAQLDGANHLTILFRIMIPCAKPTIAVVALYFAVAYWNEWFRASIYITQKNMMPLQLVLKGILASATQGASEADVVGVEEAVQYASIIFTSIPILCVYPFVQKYFVKGSMIGAVKG